FSGQGIDSLQASFDVNLGDNSVSNGQLAVSGDVGVWSFQGFNGSVNGAFVDVSNMEGSWNSDFAATGDLRGAFIGTGAQIDFVGGFALEADGGAASGLVLMHQP